MQNEYIDILMATYNGEKYIEQQINSILDQNYPYFNLIISDDNSTDNTLNIIKKYSKIDKRIKYYVQEENVGYVKNFQFLCEHSSSRLIMFSDQDDVWLDDKVKKMKECIDNSDAILVYSDLEIVDKNLNCLFPSMIRYMKKIKQCRYTDYRAVNLSNVITGCAMIADRSILDVALPFPDKVFPHDWWLGLIATQQGKIKYLDVPLVKYRQHDKNTIGIKSQNKEYVNFYDYRKSIIDFHINQFNFCNERLDDFSDSYRRIIKNSCSYFNGLINNRYSLFKNIKMFNVIYKGKPLGVKIKHFLMFHFPKISNILFTLRRKML